MLATYINIFLTERRTYLALWFAGWAVIALNYALDAFFPELLRGSRLIFLFSTASYFYANLLITLGIYSFLEIRVRKRFWVGGSAAWLMGFATLALFNVWGYALIVYVDLALYLMAFRVGQLMIEVGRKQRGPALFLGVLNIAWVFCAIAFSHLFRVDQIFVYVVMHGMRFINAIGLIQMSFSEQKSKIQSGLARIKRLSEHDELTGLYSKSYFDAKIREFDQAEDCLPISLLYGDMNGLKFVNDAFGHQEGDLWIRKAARMLEENCRKDDIISRWGGDEFAVILPRTEYERASAVLRRILEARAAQRDGIPVSISMGLATKTNMETSLNEVLLTAEKAMYEMKLVEGKAARAAIIQTIEVRMWEKGDETKEQLERLRFLAAEFASYLGHASESRADLSMAVKYMYIGKVALPDEVVKEDEVRDEREWTALKKHVEIGYRILGALGERSAVADAVLCQHEWWNGQGFPRALKGEEIPVLARILAIVRSYDEDCYPRMSSGRGDAAKALEKLCQGAGVRFDPELASRFVGMMAGEERLGAHSHCLPQG